MNKPPESDLLMALLSLISDYRMYILMALMGAWGTAVKHLEAVRKGLPLVWLEVHISLFTGAFIGVVVGLGLKSLNVNNDYLVFATIGVASNMGTVSLKLLGNAIAPMLKQQSTDKDNCDIDNKPSGDRKNGKKR